MAKHALLNNIEHKNLRINTEKSEKFGNNKMHSLAFPFEFKEIQAHYPIFFHEDVQTGNFVALALLGFEKNENLFLTKNGWDADYIPLVIEREPFLIGFQEKIENGETITNTVIHIDMDSPRISSEGEAVFLEHGGNTDYLNKIADTLNVIHGGQNTTDAFMQALKEYNLLEPFNLDIQLTNGTNNRLSGFHTINEETLYALKGEILEKLNSSGFLMLIYMVIASHANINKLIALKNKKENTKSL
ncbi:SapC family protein [Colwellia sp. UCD-KL20]|uniref:SapC family protein n=1 Tax=Colwellia sp. UCD-KL20 TaxID=1917165 RepID=UPI000970947D|nr:SapC family protein [Colwellia sp. UCD-KL20]